MNPINIENVHKILLAYCNIRFDGDKTEMWKSLENLVGFKKHTYENMIHHCGSCHVLWLQQLINIIRLPLDYWFDNEKGKEFFTKSIKNKELCKTYFITKHNWSEARLLQVELFLKVYELRGYNREVVVKELKKSPKAVSYIINNRKLPPTSKSFFSIEEFFKLIHVLQIDWHDMVEGTCVPSVHGLAHEDIDKHGPKGAHIIIVTENHQTMTLASDDFLNEFKNIAEHNRDSEGKIKEKEFLNNIELFIKKLQEL